MICLINRDRIIRWTLNKVLEEYYYIENLNNLLSVTTVEDGYIISDSEILKLKEAKHIYEHLHMHVDFWSDFTNLVNENKYVVVYRIVKIRK